VRLAADIARVTIAKITVGVRRRQKLGNLRSLAKSIEEHGLLHPILLRHDTELVAGHRRLEACKQLGWTTIPARHVDGMTDEELRAVELEENTERLALLDYETTKARLAEIRQTEAEAKREIRSGPERKSGGRPSEPGSRRDVAERGGVPLATRDRMEKHEAIAEQYPFMQKPGWVQYRVLEAGAKMAAIPEKERPAVATLLDQPAIPPKAAIGIIDNLGAMKPAERERIYDMAKSTDQHVRSNALAAAAALPPMPDPGLLLLIEAERTIRKAAKECRVPGLRPRIEALAAGVKKMTARIEAAKES